MSDRDDRTDEVEALMDALVPSSAVKIDERARIEAQMWDAFDRAESGRADASDRVGVDITHAVEHGRDVGRRDRSSWSVFAAVAASIALVVAAAVVGLRRAASEPASSDRPGVDTVAPPLADDVLPEAFTARVGDLELNFRTDDAAEVVESGTDFVALRATGLEDPFAGSDRSRFGRVVIARPGELFDGQAPEDWFDANSVDALALGARFDDETIDAWTLVLGDTAEGCVRGEACLAFGDLEGDDGSVSLVLGVFNDLRLIPIDGGEPLVIFTTHTGVRQGSSVDAVTDLRDQVLETLEIGD